MFLGAGGVTPRVVALDISTYEIANEFPLAPGHTPYVLDRSVEGSLFAVGTRRKHLYLFRDRGNGAGPDPDSPPFTELDAPPLSMCFVPGPGIVVSEVGGRCKWVRDLGNPSTTSDLETGNRRICALSSSQNTVAGWALNGDIPTWRLPALQPVSVLHALRPPRKYALSRLIRGDNGMLTCTAYDGSLVLIDLAGLSVRVLPAHQGECYAVARDGRHLVTVGRRDSRCKIWDPSEDRPVAEYQAPPDTIAAAPVGGVEGALLLIDYLGEAGIWVPQGNRLVLAHQVPGSDYRTALVAPPEELQAIRDKQVQAEIARIVQELSDCGRRLTAQEAEDCHRRLVGLGATATSLEFRARAAHALQDESPEMVAEEIHLYHRQMEHLPNVPGAIDSMVRYLAALKRGWVLDEACAICNRIRLSAPDHSAPEEAASLAEWAEAVRQGSCVVELERAVSTETIVRCASAAERHVMGRFVVNRFPPIDLFGASPEPDQVLAKYETIRSETMETAPLLPGAACERVIWLNGEDAATRDLLVPDRSIDEGPVRLRIALAWARDSAILEVPILFEIPAAGIAGEFKVHNQEVLNGVRDLNRKFPTHALLQRLYRAFQSAVHGLVNESINRRLEGYPDEHAQ